MTNKKVTRKALLMSITSLLICISMLMGTTFAWFTDEVTSGVNKIVAGNLDVKLEHYVNGTTFSEVTANTTDLFQTAASGILWEPGAMAMETFKVTNVGNLAIKYQFNINQLTNAHYSKVTWDNGTNYYDLTDVIKMVITDTRPATREAAVALFTPTASKSISKSESVTLQTSSLEASASKEFTVVLYWAPDSDNNVTDNLHNLKNTGWSLLSPANVTTAITAHDTNNDTKDYLYIEPSVTLLATQQTSEYDSFDNTYDAFAETSKWNAVTSASANANVTGNNPSEKTATLTAPVAPATSGSTTVKLTAPTTGDNALSSATSAKLDVKTTDILNSSREFNITGTSATSEAVAATIDLTLTLTKTTTVSESTTTTTETATSGFIAKVETYVAKGLSDVTVNYNGDANLKFGSSAMGTSKNSESEVTAVGDYFYHADTGKLVFITDHFSQYLVGTKSVAYLDQDSDGNDINTAYLTVIEALTAAREKDAKWEAPRIILLNNATYQIPDDVTEERFYVVESENTILTVDNKNGSYIVDKKQNTDGVNTEITISSNAVCVVTSLNDQSVNQKYTSLQSAFNSVPENDKNAQITIKLLQDITLEGGEWKNYVSKSVITDPINGGAQEVPTKLATDITIDLNGHTLKAANAYNFLQIKCEDAITATVTDSSTKVKLRITDSADSKRTISHVELSGVDMTIDNGITYEEIRNLLNGTNTINGVTLTTDYASNKPTT